MGIINENVFITRNIDFNSLSKEDQNIIINIPYVDFTYICIYCQKIPQIDIKYDEREGYIKTICLEECGRKIKLDNNNNFGLKKAPLEALYKKNYMNINNIEILKNKSKLPFETINELIEYLKAYKSYLNLREVMKKYNFGDERNNELFSLFGDLLQIGFYGLGTHNEYKNSIIIKEYLMEKFKKFNKIQVLTNGLKLFKFNYITFRNTNNVIPLKNNIIALNYYNKNYYNKFCLLKLTINNGIFFEPNIYQKYLKFDSYKDIPIEFRKNFILCNENIHFEKIFDFGENEYLIKIKGDKILYNYYFDDNKNQYFYKTFEINIKEDIANIFVLKNKDIMVITFDLVYILTTDYSSNSLICIKQFLDLNVPYQAPNLLEMKNGNFIINFPKKLICFSESYEIISIFKFLNVNTQFFDMIKLNNENIIFGNMGKLYHLNTRKFNFNFFEISETVNFGIYENILGMTYSDYFTLFDYKLNKTVYKENFGDSYYWINPRFILIDKNKNIFGFISNGNSSNLYLKIFQINN